LTTRIDGMPIYASRPCELDAEVYNLWRRAHLHFNSPMRIDLPGLKQMVLIIDEHSWVVVDQVQYDMPVLAWVDLQLENRDNLHLPVPCTLNYYHYMASAVRAKALACMSEALTLKLKELD